MTGGSRDCGSHFGMQLNKKHLLQPSSSPVRIAYKLKGPGWIVCICWRPLLSTAWCVMGTLQRIKQWNQGTCYLVDCILSGLIVHCQRFQELQNSEKFRPTARPQCKALNAQEFDLDVLESVQNSEENSLTREILFRCDVTTDSSDQYPWNSTPCHPHQSLPQCNVCHLTSLSKSHPS